MRVKRKFVATVQKSKTIRFKTTLFDLFSGLVDGEISDVAAVASVRRIFAHCDVRLARTLTPLRLSPDPRRITRNRSKNRLRWA